MTTIRRFHHGPQKSAVGAIRGTTLVSMEKGEEALEVDI